MAKELKNTAMIELSYWTMKYYKAIIFKLFGISPRLDWSMEQAQKQSQE